MSDVFIAHRFRVSLTDSAGALLCQGSFSDVTGLEATSSPKTVREGGRNYGDVQLAGKTTFSPIVLRRGITEIADLWRWFDVTTRGANYGLRYDGTIEVLSPDPSQGTLLLWRITDAMPVKFKGPDLSSTASQVALEELHLVHEGLTLERPAASAERTGS